MPPTLNKNDHGEEEFYVSLRDVMRPYAAPVAVEVDADTAWSSVWAEATVLPGRESDTAPVVMGTAVHSQAEKKADVQVDIEEQAKTPEDQVASRESNDLARSPKPPCTSILDAIIGNSFALAAVLSTFGMEVSAVIVYFVAVAFAKMATYCDPHGVLVLFYGIFMFNTFILLGVDSFILALSVFVSELVGILGYGVVFLVGGPCTAKAWHQHIRKLSHLVRCAFRNFHKDWKPERKMMSFGDWMKNAEPSEEN